MTVRRYVRDSRGRFSSSGNGTISRGRPERPATTGGSMTRALRRGQRALYRAEQDRMQMLGGNVAGMRIIQRDIRKGAAARSTAAPSGTQRGNGRVSDALRGTLRQLAQSDARFYRGVSQIAGQGSTGPKRVGGSSRKPRRLKGG